jgi:predicted ATPase
VFFDRGLIDAAANLQFLTGEPVWRRLVNLTVTIGECF